VSLLTLRNLARLAVLVSICAACAGIHRAPSEGCAAGGGTAPGTLNCYLVQLHLHGHSNHNGNALPASIESHTAEAAKNGFDVVWWTDHAELFDTFEDLPIGFADATMASTGDTVMLGSRQGRQVSKIIVERPAAGSAVGESAVTVEDGRLSVRVGARPNDEQFVRLALEPASRLGTVRTIQFCRPVASGLRVDAWLRAEGVSPDSYLRFDFDLSWHPMGRHRVRFEGVAANPAPPMRLNDSTVVAEFEVPDTLGPVSLDLEAAAGLLPSGRDNTLSSLRVEVGARRGAAVAVEVDSLVVRSTKPEGANQFATVDYFAAKHAEDQGVVSHVGVEVGKIHLPSMPHMNAYMPGRAQGPDDLLLDSKTSREEWIAEVHRRGGLVSFNHPFGASRNPRSRRYAEDEDEDALPAESPRVLQAAGAGASEQEFWEIADPLLETKALGADLLEAGYLYRGVGSLDDHLRLWDLALANGIRLVGDGTTDSHGGVWGPDMIPNPFATWIWAASPSAADLMNGMRRGHVAFGDPFAWKSDFIFLASPASGGGRGRSAGGAGGAVMMGDTLVVPAGSAVETWAEITPARGDVEIVQVLVRIKPGREVEAARSKAPSLIGASPTEQGQAKSVGGNAVADAGWQPYRFRTVVGDSCYVRLEVRARDGRPLVFSNPIYLFAIK
jgi:hypothetical protein